MNILRLYLFGKNLIPYFEEREEEKAAGEESGTAEEGSSWLRKVHRQVLHLYRMLESKFPLNERLCTRLLSAGRAHAVYSSAATPEEARIALHRFFHRQARRHRFWFGTDFFLACLGALLMPLPGPNIFFFYPAVRAYSNYRAWRGAARGLHFAFQWEPSEEIRNFESRLPRAAGRDFNAQVGLLSERLLLPGLTTFLAKKKVYR